MQLLRAARVFTGTEMLHDAAVLTDRERVVAVGPADVVTARAGGSGDIVDLGDVTLAPGLVDAHCHGGGGAAFPEDPHRAAALHRAHGTTTIVASLVTQSLDELERQVRALAPLVSHGLLAGLHLEGPWLAERYKGAHPADKLRDPEPGEVAALLDAGVVDGRETVAMVTIAVERPGALESVRLMTSRGVVAALGHSESTYEEALAAIDAGVRGATHLFNAVPPLAHRAPGPVLALLDDPRVWCELIVDGVHVRPELAAWVLGVSERVVLVTDAMAAAGCADGDYGLGDLDVEVRGGMARIAGTDTIAGSTLTLSRAVQVAIDAGVDPVIALRAVTSHPARYLSLPDVGVLEPGARADAVAFGPDWSVKRVLHRGAWVDRTASA